MGDIKICFAKIKAHVKENKLDRNIKSSDIRMMARRIAAAGGDALSPSDFKAKVTDMIEQDHERLMAKIKAERTMFIAKRVQLVSDAIENARQWQLDIKQGKKDYLGTNKPEEMPFEASRAIFQGGSNRPGINSNVDLANMSAPIKEHFLDVFNTALNSVQGLREAAASGKLDRDLWPALHALDNKLPTPSNIDPLAHEYAKAVKATRDEIFKRKQGVTPWLEQAQDYLIKMFHDPDRIQEMGKEKWMKLALDTYGDKSFPEMTPKEKEAVFSDIHDRILSGEHGTTMNDANDSRFVNVPGDGGNVARQMGQSRQLIPRDWQAARDYQTVAGPETVHDGLMRTLDQAAKNQAQIEKYGPNPKDMYKAVIAGIKAKLTGEELKHFDNPTQQKYLKDSFEVSMGSQNRPAENLYAKTLQGSMTAAYLTKVGMSLPKAAMHNIVATASLITDARGNNMLMNAHETAAKWIQAMLPFSDKTARLHDLGMAERMYNQELYRGMTGPGSKPGAFGRMAEKIGSLNLHQRSVDAFRSVIGTLFSKWMGEDVGTAHEALEPQKQKVLARYGIDQPTWDFIRQGEAKLDGKQALTPESVKNISDEATEAHMRSIGSWSGEKSPSADQLESARFKESLKVSNLLNDHANMGSAQAGTRQRMAMYGNTEINSSKGMVLRALQEFHAPALVQSDVYRRNVLSGSGGVSNYAGLATHYAMSVTATALATSFLHAVTGKTQEDPKSKAYWAKIMLSSGALGTITDPLQNSLMREKPSDQISSMLEGLLGPVASTAAQLAVHGAHAIAGTKGEKAKLFNTVLDNTPGIGTLHNLFYTKALYDYHLYNGWKNYMDSRFKGNLEAGSLSHGQGYNFGRPTSRNFLESK